jgi:hypothetical protein
MAAYNWIEFYGQCPSCATDSQIRAQVHIAASYNGDASGRFHNRVFGLGDPMAWWPTHDTRFGTWSANAHPGHLPHVREACYSNCLTCTAELCVVLVFSPIQARSVIGIWPEADWPNGY